MDVIHPKCAGLDVHKDSVVACARIGTGPKIAREVKTFGTTTRDLLALADWLTARGCTHVAMEATGVYWKPVWHVLEGSFELVLATAMHIRNIPGRKTDVNDATWIADLLAHGLIRGSFVPAPPLQDLRDLTRTRTQLVRERARHILRIQKTLENANLKLASVLTDVLGVTGRRLLEALIAGESDPERLADLAHDRRLKASLAEFVDALHGRITAHPRFILGLHLRQIDALDTAVRELEARLCGPLPPFRAALARLTTIRGIGETAAHVLI